MPGSKLKVLHCIYDDPQNPWLGGGGAWRARYLYQRLSASVDVTVVTGSFPGAKDETVDGVRYQRVGLRGPYAVSRASYAAVAGCMLRRAEYDAAVFDFSTYTPIFVPRDRAVGITVHHLTGSGARERWGRVLGAGVERLERAMLQRGSRFSAASASTSAELRRLAAAGVEIEVIHPGVADTLLSQPRREQGYLFFCGRLDVLHKGLDTLLQAFALLVRDEPGLVLRIAGSGKDAARVRALVAAHALEARVELLGSVTRQELEALYAGAIVQLMPSRFEGFGMVAAEAMAAGVPLIATTRGALPEVVADAGVLVPADDPQALAAAVRALVRDPARRAHLSAAARARAARFRWHPIAEAHLEFLQRIAAGA